MFIPADAFCPLHLASQNLLTLLAASVRAVCRPLSTLPSVVVQTASQGLSPLRVNLANVSTLYQNLRARHDHARAQIDGKKLPWALSVAPTEPVLGPTRRLIPPVRCSWRPTLPSWLL